MSRGQLDFCDVCGDHTLRSQLVKTQVRWLRAAGSNHFPYSLYNSTYWTCDATDKLEISAGNWEARCRVADDNTVTEVNGEQTWDGTDKTFRLISPIDISGWTSLCMSANVSAYHASITPSMTVKLGCCNSDGSTKYVQRTWTYRGGNRCWFTATIADLVSDGVTSSAAYFYIEVTTDGYWHITNLQLEDDATSPGEFIYNTDGAAVEYSSETPLTSIRKVCKDCRETLQRESQLTGTPRKEPIETVRVMIQEN